MSHSPSKSITINEIAERAGLSVRQAQRLAKAGKMPSVTKRADGYHNTYALTPDLKKWIAERSKRSKGRQKQIIEENDNGTENFGTAINRIVALDGKLKRAGNYDKMTVEQLFELHTDFLPAVKVWRGVVNRFDDLPPELESEFREQLAELSL